MNYEFIDGRMNLYGLLDDRYIRYVIDSFPLGAYSTEPDRGFFNARYVFADIATGVPFIHIEPFNKNPKSLNDIFFKRPNPLFMKNTMPLNKRKRGGDSDREGERFGMSQSSKKTTIATPGPSTGCCSSSGIGEGVKSKPRPVATTASSSSTKTNLSPLNPAELEWFQQSFGYENSQQLVDNLPRLNPSDFNNLKKRLDSIPISSTTTAALANHLAYVRYKVEERQKTEQALINI